MTNRKRRKWPVYLIGSSAAVAVWSGWVGLGEMCGFGPIHPLPGIWDSFHLNTAITLPIGVEAYGAYAMGAWMSVATPLPARKFARRSALGSLGLGMLGQVAFHLLTAFHRAAAPWPIVMAVSCLPVVTLGFAAALVHLLHSEVTAPARPRPEPVPARAAPVQALREPSPRLERAGDTSAPWKDAPQPVFTPVDGPETGEYPQPVGMVSVRNPMQRLDRKIAAGDRTARTGSFSAVAE